MNATVCPINPPGHDWQAGLACRWCDATRTPSEAVLSGLASVCGWSREAARAVHDAHRAEILAEAKNEVVAWLVKKDRENTPVGHLASKVDRGAVRIFLGTGHYRDAMDAHRAEVLTEVIDDLTNCLRLGGMQRLGLVLARKRVVALRDGTPAEAPRRNVKHAEAAQRLREQPGEWLPVGNYASDQGAYGIARHINLGTIPAYQPAGAYRARFETTDNGARVVARYVGAEAGDDRG